jgi:hypothetical protein
VLLPEVVGALGVGELDEVLEDVVGAGVARLVPLAEARVLVLAVLVALEPAVGVVVVLGGAVLVVDLVALEPLLEPHRAHDVVVGHRVEGVESVLDALLRAERDLEGVGDARARLPDVVVDLDVLEAPRLEDAAVGVVGLGGAVALVDLVEEEDLRRPMGTLL